MKRAAVFAVVLAIAAAFSLFYRMGRRDIRDLKEFILSYEIFDRAIADYSAYPASGTEEKAGSALAELQAKTNLRLSSLIKNDAKLMETAHEIAESSAEEWGHLRAYKNAILSDRSEKDARTREQNELSSRRKAAYARFQELAPVEKSARISR